MSREKLLLCSVFIRFILVLAVAMLRAEARHQETHEIFTIKGDGNEVIYWTNN